MTARELLADVGAARRRVVVSVLGLAAAVLLVGGCSSSTAGSGGGGGGFPGGSSTAPVSAPGGGGPTSVSGGGGGSGDFCSEWLSGSSTSGLSGGQVQANFVAHWDKLAAIAPAQIKSDVQAIDAYLHTVLDQHPDPSKAASLATAVSNVVQYVAKNCH